MSNLFCHSTLRRLQESSLGLSMGGSAGYQLDVGRMFLFVYTVFRDFEALALDSHHLISHLPAYLPVGLTLRNRGRLRSEGPQLGVLWEPQETPGKPQETPGNSQEASGKKKSRNK